MNEEELSTFRLQVRIAVRDALLQFLVEQARRQSLSRADLQGLAQEMLGRAAKMTFAVHPAVSDQAAAEVQEAMREMLDALGL